MVIMFQIAALQLVHAMKAKVAAAVTVTAMEIWCVEKIAVNYLIQTHLLEWIVVLVSTN